MAEKHIGWILNLVVLVLYVILCCHRSAYTQQWQNDISCFHSEIVYKYKNNNMCKFPPFCMVLEGRRTSGYDDATAGSLKAAQRLGVANRWNMNKCCYSNYCGCKHGECKKLAQYAIVRPSGGLRQVAVAAMVHAVGTLGIGWWYAVLVRVNRRQ